MREPRGSCFEDCPVIGILQGREDAYNQASMHDGLLAEKLNHVPNAQDVIMEGCPLGGPHHRRFSLAKLACSSEVLAGQHQIPQSEAGA
jgi:hypothetical protein